MDKQAIDKANKAQLRKLCREAGIKYGSLPVEGMRTLLRAKLNESNDYARERLSDPVVIERVKKAPVKKVITVMDLLRAVEVGASFSCEAIAKRAGATVASVRTIVGSCNSTAPSNARFHKSGLRFEVKRGADEVRRLK